MPDLKNSRGLQFLLNLSACPVAAFYDQELNALLGLDGIEESVLYLAAVGESPPA